MDLLKLKTVQWLSIIGAVAGILALLAGWVSPYRAVLMVAVLILTALFLLLELEQGRVSVFFTGLSRYYPSFGQNQTEVVLKAVETEYCYFGISFSTVLNSFRQWYEAERRGNIGVRLLLLDPQATEILEFQARCEYGLLGGDLSTQEAKLIHDTVQRSQAAITHALSTLATLKEGTAKVEVRFHREKVRHWIHLVDNAVAYVGLLRNGENGLTAPVLMLKPRFHKWNLFNCYQEEWQSIWAQAQVVTIGQPIGAGAPPVHTSDTSRSN
jgi:hypothetical protein